MSGTEPPPPAYEAVWNQHQVSAPPLLLAGGYTSNPPNPPLNFCFQCGAPAAKANETGVCICGTVLLPGVVVTRQPGSSNPDPVISGQTVSHAQQDQSYVEPDDDQAVRKGERLIIDFEKVSCFPCETTGFTPEVRFQVPKELLEKGVTYEQWQAWIDDLMKVQGKSPSIIGCLTIFCFPGLFVQSALCACFCPTSMAWPLDFLPCYYGDWYRGLNKWQENVNSVLRKKGMFAKLMTYKPHGNAPLSRHRGSRVTGKDHNYEMSFLEIAFTEEESKRLMQESWDHGVNDGCTSGRGRCL